MFTCLMILMMRNEWALHQNMVVGMGSAHLTPALLPPPRAERETHMGYIAKHGGQRNSVRLVGPR